MTDKDKEIAKDILVAMINNGFVDSISANDGKAKGVCDAYKQILAAVESKNETAGKA